LAVAVLVDCRHLTMHKLKEQTAILLVFLEQDLQPSARVVAVVVVEHFLEVVAVVLAAVVVAGIMAVLARAVVLEQQMKALLVAVAVTFTELVAVVVPGRRVEVL